MRGAIWLLTEDRYASMTTEIEKSMELVKAVGIRYRGLGERTDGDREARKVGQEIWELGRWLRMCVDGLRGAGRGLLLPE